MLAFGECVEHIKKFGRRSRRLDFAVAFWGRDAGRNLGLTEEDCAANPDAAPRIICNLRLGGTNPREIERLIAAGIDVKHDDRLHAKVYRFDEKAIVGSANASANGLGFDSSEARWFEASCIIESPEVLGQIDEWFEERWRKAAPVSPGDLKVAKENYKRNRAKRSAIPSDESAGLMEVMRGQPEAFADKPIYLVCNLAPYSKDTAKKAERRSAQTGRDIDFYEDWKPPTEALLLDFNWYNKMKGKPKFEGMYRTYRSYKNKSMRYEVEGVTSSAPDEAPVMITPRVITKELEQWQNLIAESRLRFKTDWDSSGCLIPLERLAAFLHRLGEGPVLNVLDENKRYRVEAGRGVSGNWRRPDKEPTRIRVYQSRGGESVAGGTIVRRDQVGDRTIIVFDPDDAEHGRPWPIGRFRTNGCLQTVD